MYLMPYVLLFAPSLWYWTKILICNEYIAAEKDIEECSLINHQLLGRKAYWRPKWEKTSYVNGLPFGKSWGLTSSRKKACASCGHSDKGTSGLNQNFKALASRVWLPVTADTKYTQNSSWAWHGSVTPFSKTTQYI